MFLSTMRAQPGHGRPSDAEVKEIAQRLKAARTALGIDQAELCRRTGIKPNTYNQWERGVGSPSRLQVRLLKRALGWSLDYVFEGDIHAMPGEMVGKLRQALECVREPT